MSICSTRFVKSVISTLSTLALPPLLSFICSTGSGTEVAKDGTDRTGLVAENADDGAGVECAEDTTDAFGPENMDKRRCIIFGGNDIAAITSARGFRTSNI